MSTRISGIGMTSQRTRLRMITRLREQGITDEAVLNVMNEIPRHIFVEEALASRAYDDCALPIGFGQTISQPYIVARMSELLTAGKPPGKGPTSPWRNAPGWTRCPGIWACGASTPRRPRAAWACRMWPSWR